MRSKEFTKVLYETTEYIINVPIKIKMEIPNFNSVQEPEETEVELDPDPVSTITVVKNAELEDEKVAYVGSPSEDPMPKSNIRRKSDLDPSKTNPNPVFVSPLQQEIELKKAEVGKDSPVIKKLTQDEIRPPKKYS